MPAADNSPADVLEHYRSELPLVLLSPDWALSTLPASLLILETSERLHGSYALELGRSVLEVDDQQPQQRARVQTTLPMQTQLLAAHAWRLRGDSAAQDYADGVAAEETVRRAVLGVALPTGVRLGWAGAERRTLRGQDEHWLFITQTFNAWHPEYAP